MPNNDMPLKSATPVKLNRITLAKTKKISIRTFVFFIFSLHKRFNMNPLVGIIMGSESDLEIMKGAAEMLRQFEVEPELTIVSAHRTPNRLAEYAKNAKGRGIKVIIAGAGGAAHLPGMVAAQTILPVIGVPVKSSNSVDGWDSILSILQMPYGVPVATVALNGAKNAGILAAQILALHDTTIAGKLEAYKEYLDDIVMESVKNAQNMGYRNEFDVTLP
jgi:5-(carboxyamino)imidazole ribonucleotide mutase